MLVQRGETEGQKKGCFKDNDLFRGKECVQLHHTVLTLQYNFQINVNGIHLKELYLISGCKTAIVAGANRCRGWH
jgi:hypothetical protein